MIVLWINNYQQRPTNPVMVSKLFLIKLPWGYYFRQLQLEQIVIPTDISSRRTSPNMHYANAEAQLNEIYQEEMQKFHCQTSADLGIRTVGSINKKSTALHKYSELKDEHTRLVRQLNTLKLQISALKIETDYLKQKEHKQEQLNLTNLCFSQSIKATVFKYAQQALNDQNPVTFPNHFFTRIFSMFVYDKCFMEQCNQVDVLLDEAVHKLCIKEYQAQELSFKQKVNKKLTDTKKAQG